MRASGSSLTVIVKLLFLILPSQANAPQTLADVLSQRAKLLSNKKWWDRLVVLASLQIVVCGSAVYTPDKHLALLKTVPGNTNFILFSVPKSSDSWANESSWVLEEG